MDVRDIVLDKVTKEMLKDLATEPENLARAENIDWDVKVVTIGPDHMDDTGYKYGICVEITSRVYFTGDYLDGKL